MASDDNFDAFAAAQQVMTADAAASKSPEQVDIEPVCFIGPCKNLVECKIPVSPNNPATVVKHSCRMGVNFDLGGSSGPTDSVIGKFITQSTLFPITCNQWAPWTDEEIADLESRRATGQDRANEQRKAEALQTENAEPAAEFTPVTVKSEIPDGTLPESFVPTDS